MTHLPILAERLSAEVSREHVGRDGCYANLNNISRQRWSWLIMVGLIVLILLYAGYTEAAKPVGIAIDTSVTHQVMDGFGSSSRVWDDPHVANVSPTVIPLEVQNEILTRLYTDLGLTRVRPATGGGIEPVNDNDDPFTFDWSKFNFEWKRNDAHVDFVKQAIPYGLKVYFLSPIILEKWMTESNPEEYVERAMAVLLRWRALGVELPFYSITMQTENPTSTSSIDRRKSFARSL